MSCRISTINLGDIPPAALSKWWGDCKWAIASGHPKAFSDFGLDKILVPGIFDFPLPFNK